MRRFRDRNSSGALRLIIYYMTIHTHAYMHRTGEIQSGREARPPWCIQNTLISPSRIPPILTAGVRGFVALNPETVTGGNNEWPRFERHDAQHGNTPRRRIQCHVHDHITSRRPSDVINVSHPGGLRAIVRGRGRPRAAWETSEEEWGTRWDAIGATKVMTSCWGLDKDRGEVEIAQKVVGGHVVGWWAEALKSINNASMTGCAVPEPWIYPNPDQSAHHDPN